MQAASSKAPSLGALAVVAGLLGSGALVWTSTEAAFTAVVTNPGNSWTSGSVALTDDDTGSAMFTALNLSPGDTGTKCIKVTYGASQTASVKMRGTQSGSLAQYVNLQIEEGNGGSFNSCLGFSGNLIYNGTVQGFGTSATDFASGVGSWTPTGAAQTRTYRITYTLSPSTPNTQQSSTASADFIWEAHS
ncbi:hypothetical protein FL583_23925 [Cryptosporangium phraense]|uniref:Camelysin metallo-endopeptidase n=1 Tax=Cryptosporangium phraense TaxID=2593070 RepID=A0A545AMK6_9ACTN|nr:hypothetical protein FL583_23925 [Cryptosporangium phraense]